ncbi:hypothetical protein [Persicobacter diffluens]|uniref:hypothetical protein n=1 Tax=Persicobacter diffluens TaxID=981 RepID=UPI0030C748DF
MFNSLHSKLTQEFPKWGKACWKNVLALSLGIIRKGTVCLNKVKDSIGSILDNQRTSASGHYKRLTAYLRNILTPIYGVIYCNYPPCICTKVGIF